MPRRALTDRFCATAKARDGEAQTDYFDEATPGLALRVAASGYKAWTHHFTWADKRARLKIGTYPTTSLRAARTRADEAKSPLRPATIRDLFLQRVDRSRPLSKNTLSANAA